MTSQLRNALERIKNTTAGQHHGKLNHECDENFARECFEELRAQNVSFSSAEIYEWAIANGWKADDAMDLAKIAEDVLLS
jgi:hypothetical protein